jgi:indole-3-glycerol phosphate synthase
MIENFLENIVDYKKRVNRGKQPLYSALKRRARECERPHLFKRSILKPGEITLIAEIKKASPSKGIICESFDPIGIAQVYSKHKVAAISVLTEDKYFMGSPEMIKQITEKIELPVLTKDFIIDEGQIYEAWSNGASAVLLIVAILNDNELESLIRVANSLGLDTLVEVHCEEELQRACDAGADIIGVNNRDLQSFEVDIQTCIKLIPKIPNSKVKVAESGFHTYKEIQGLKGLGAHAVLIGETFMAAKDIGNKIEEVMHGQG